MGNGIHANLDISMSKVPQGQVGHYALYADGTVGNPGLCDWVLHLFYDPTLPTLTHLFQNLVDEWIVLCQPTEHYYAPSHEVASQARRIAFVAKFMTEQEPRFVTSSYREPVVDSLTKMMPGKSVDFSMEIRRLSESVFDGIEGVLGWRLQELVPIPLSCSLLQAPSCFQLLDDLPPPKSEMDELPGVYATLVNQCENPGGSIWSFLAPLWPFSPCAIAKSKLVKMCRLIEEKKHLYPYVETRVLLRHLVDRCKDSSLSLAKRKEALDEMVEAADKCDPRVNTEAERQLRRLLNRSPSLVEQFLQWKADFIEQCLLEFLKTKISHQDDRHNTHFLNGIFANWGQQLGFPDLKAPATDQHVVRQLPFTLDMVLTYLQECWNRNIVDLILLRANTGSSLQEIQMFLIEAVKAHLPGIESPEAFVAETYFDEMSLLNEQGAIRFLREISASFAVLPSSHRQSA